jgi:hypothetical protein
VTIRKIANRTTSLAVSASTTQSGIFKAAVQQQSSIQRLQNLSQTLVPKIANASAKIIDHLLYDPEGQGLRALWDYLFLTERPSLNFNKSSADAIAGLDSILLQTVKNRQPLDVLNTDETISFLLRARRTFDQSVDVVSNPAKLFIKAPINEVQSFLDNFSIVRVKTFFENITAADDFSRRITVSRTIDDSVGMLDAFTFIDGSTFSLNRHIYEFLTVGSEGTGLRTSGNNLENISFVFDKFLDPDMEILDVLAKGYSKGATEEEIIADVNKLRFTKPVADSITTDQTQTIWANKGNIDTAALTELLIRSFGKTLSDETTMLDSMEFADHIIFAYEKLFTELSTASDLPALLVNKPVSDQQEFLDVFTKVAAKNQTESTVADDLASKYIDKLSSDYLSLLDTLIFVRGRNYEDLIGTDDFKSFLFAQLLADTVTADDPLVRLSDGINHTSIIQKNDTYTPTDYFARKIEFYRYPHHGFLSPVYPLEQKAQLILKDARAGALTSYPILRTNLISWSEQFDQSSYWATTGLRISSNAVVAPANVVTSPSPTYDADQLQELFTNQPLDPYGKAWYQLVPGRWTASSDGDLLVATTGTSQHYITTPNILSLTTNQNFSYAVYLKYAGTRYVRLVSTVDVWADFDLVNNTIVDKTANRASIQAIGNGWVLCWIENRVVSSGAAPELQILHQILLNSLNSQYGTDFLNLVPELINQKAQIYLLDDSRNATFAGNGTSGVVVWGAQLEIGDQVEQEVSSLKYIRTAGGPASRIGFSVTPNDKDRVFVGTLQRSGLQQQYNDAFESIAFKLNYSIKDQTTATPTDYFARKVTQFLTPSLNDSSGLGQTVTVGSPNITRTPSDTETLAIWFNKAAKSSGSSTASTYKTVRTNLIRWSERLDYDYWLKTNVRATTGIAIMAGALPYRNVVLDASQLYDIYFNKKYTYERSRWYDIVPLRNKPNFTSNAIIDIFESSSNSIHTVQTFGYAQNLSGNFFASSIYASPNNGVTKFRLQVGWVWADFDLSAVSVITSSGTLYNNITTMDSSSGWYLCQIVGPTQALGVLNYLDSIVTPDAISLIQPRFVGNDPVSILELRQLLPNLGKSDVVVSTDQRLGNYIRKEFSETRMIPRNTGIDALRVAGIDLVSRTSSSVNLNKFTPLETTDASYYRAWDWYSLTPLFSSARFAVGNAGIGPKMIDNMALGDDFTWAGSIVLNSADNFVRPGSRLGGAKYAGDPFETIDVSLNKQPRGDGIVAGTSSGTRLQPSQSSSESVKFDFKLNFYENRSIPQYPQYDAEIVSELFSNVQRSIDGRAYTPVNQGTLVYRSYKEWYYLAPKFSRPRIAIGPGDRTGPYMLDNFAISDGLKYSQQKYLTSAAITIGTSSYTTNLIYTGTSITNIGVRYAGDTQESLDVNLRKTAKQSTFTDLYVRVARPSPLYADQVQEIFYNSSNANTAYIRNNPFKRSWYQLAPYYSSYDHIKQSPMDTDRVILGTGRIGKKHVGWPLEQVLFWTAKIFADDTTVLDNMMVGDTLTYETDKYIYDTLTYGSPVGFNIKDDKENVSFVAQLRAKRAGTRSIQTFDISNNTITDAQLTAEQKSVTAKTWYKLAPYYGTYVNIIDEPADYDRVRIGSQTSGKRTNADPFERVSFFQIPATLQDTAPALERKGNYVIKELSETRMIPQNPRYDALRVAGLDLVNKTTSIVNLTQYTPISGSTTYYAARDWYSEVPRFNRARFALGNAGTGPVMLDNMSFGDNLTYSGNKYLSSIILTVGTSSYTTNLVYTTTSVTNIGVRYHGDTQESLDINLRKSARQSVFTDLYVKNRPASPLDADQIQEIFYNSSNNVSAVIRNNPYKKAWYQLAPYYNSYGHLNQTPADTDRIILSYKEIVQLLPAKTLSSNHVVIGTDAGFRRQSSQGGGETAKFSVLLTAHRGSLTSAAAVLVSKTNQVTYSENFATEYWGKTNASVIAAPQLMSGSYPYRNTNFDATQIAEQYYMLGTSSIYTRYNNYYDKAWYAQVPLTNRVAFSSTVLQYMTDQDNVGQHYMQAEVQLADYSIPEEYATFSLHVQRQSGTSRFRMDMGRLYADFDLSSVSVVTSTADVLFANIRTVDTSAGVFLCQLVAPIRTYKNTLIRFTVSSDTITAGDAGLSFLRRDRRTFADAAAAAESINNDKITDYM